METVSTSSLTTPFPVDHKKTSLEIKSLGRLISIVDVNAIPVDQVVGGNEILCTDQGNKTDVIVCRYDDYFMVMVTQLGCVGTILHARKEEGFAIDPTFNVSVIFGKRDEPLLVACGRQLIEHISSCGSSRPLLLTLGLKDHSPGTLKEIISAVIENRLW